MRWSLFVRSLLSAGAIFAGCWVPTSLAAAETAGATWYLALDGDDQAVGDLAHPFATIDRAQDAAAPGDVILIRGGTYRMPATRIARREGVHARVIVLDKDGTRDRPLTYRAYPGEHPVFDFSAVMPADARVTAFLITASWIRFADLDITGVQVSLTGHTQSICVENAGDHNLLARLRLHDGQAIGIYCLRGSANLFLDCDAWANWDHTSENRLGGNVDGFGCHPRQGATGNVFRGCRAWNNSDDGFDCINSAETVTFENCWAFRNGLSATGEKRADGNGFKAGGYGSTPVDRLPSPIPRHVVRGCLAVGNRNSGFYANHHLAGCDWISNTAFGNGINFNLLGRLPDNRTDVDGSGHVLRFNVSHGSRSLLAHFTPAQNTAELNLVAGEVQDADFRSVDLTELSAPRQADGSLPAIRFLRPAPTGALIVARRVPPPSGDHLPAFLGALAP